MMLNKKGITPIISVILLLMMTIAIAGLAYTWLQRMQGNIEGTAEETTNVLIGNMNVDLRLDGYSFQCENNTINENSTIIFYVRNRGSSDAHNIQLYINSQVVLNATGWEVDGTIDTLSAGELDIDTMNVTEINCSDYEGQSTKIELIADEDTYTTNIRLTCNPGTTCSP